MFKIVITVVVFIAIAVLAGFIVIYGGLYNIAATDHHWAPTRWLISTLTDNAVEHRAASIEVPGNLDDPDRITRGFEHFDEMCVDCHGAPGIDRDEFAEGLYPGAPRLERSTRDMTPAEVFWIVKNGIKMTGMPAFTSTHSDEAIWDITAFVKKLPELSPEQYMSYRQTSGEGEEREDHEGHDH